VSEHIKVVCAEDGFRMIVDWSCPECGYEQPESWDAAIVAVVRHVDGLDQVTGVCPDCGARDEFDVLVRPNRPD
jgi:rubredoxin